MTFFIGDVEIETPFIAAPLAGISNPVYRKLCHNYGAGLVVSEMISDKALHYKNQRTFDMCAVHPDEHPVALQLFGSDTDTMAEAARYLTENTDCDIIDINMGCPVNKVIKARSGSYLMLDEKHAYEIVKAVKDNTNKPVTVKMRAGWDKDHINCVEIAKLAEQAGADAIAIHGRTRSQMYAGQSDNRYIRMVKEAVSVPVIGNGDIKTVDDAKRMFDETGCDAVMIGRGLLGKPYFMQELVSAWKGEEYIRPSYEERLQLCETYTEDLCEYEGEVIGIRMMRGLASWFVMGMPHASKIKNQLSSMKKMDDMREIFSAYRELLKETE